MYRSFERRIQQVEQRQQLAAASLSLGDDLAAVRAILDRWAHLRATGQAPRERARLESLLLALADGKET